MTIGYARLLSARLPIPPRTLWSGSSERRSAAMRKTALRAAAATRYFASDHRDAAWAQAKRALLASSGRDSSRSWAGGPALASIHVMQEVDFGAARPPIFTRFAELAAQDSLLLVEVAREMPQFIDVFAPIDQTVLADDVSDYLEELIGAPGAAGVSSSGDVDDALPLVDVVRGVIVELLGSPYRLAWTTAQRAALEMHRRGYPSSALLVGAFDDERVPRGRCLALADAEITEGRALGLRGRRENRRLRGRRSARHSFGGGAPPLAPRHCCSSASTPPTPELAPHRATGAARRQRDDGRRTGARDRRDHRDDRLPARHGCERGRHRR